MFLQLQDEVDVFEAVLDAEDVLIGLCIVTTDDEPPTELWNKVHLFLEQEGLLMILKLCAHIIRPFISQILLADES